MQCSSLEIREGGNKGNLDSKAQVSVLETIQDLFLIELGIKPLIEIRVFSLNNVILRLIKIMNRADKNRAHF